MNRMITFVVFTCLACCSSYGYASQQWSLVPEQSKITFTLKSTLHDVEGYARTISSQFQEDSGIAQGSFNVDVAGLTTDHFKRDKNMYTMFDLEKYTQIHFDFDHVDFKEALTSGHGPVLFNGVMTIHHMSKPLSVTATAHLVDGVLVIEGEFPINLNDYQLKPPSVMGIIRVNKIVNVKYSIVLTTKE